jgi:hypothetical protein
MFPGLKVEIKRFKSHSRLIVESLNNIFGPKPFLAFKTKGNDYYWQTFDFESPNTWSYSFDSSDILIDHISKVGIAANTIDGVTEVVNIDVSKNKQDKYVLNQENQLVGI